MKKKRMIALILIICMSLPLLMACSSAEGEKESKALVSTADKAQSDTENSQMDTDGEGSIANNFSDKEHYTIKLMMFGDASTEDCEEVAARLSEITEEKLNADVEIVRIGFGSYLQQLNLALSSGEALDLFSPFTTSVSSLANNGQIISLDELLPEYASETYAAISDSDWECATVNGKIYGVPANKDKAYSLGFMMRKDILDELGIDAGSLEGFDDLHNVLMQVKEAYPDMYPVITNYGDMFTYLGPDTLAGAAVLIDPVGSKDLTATNLYASDFFRERCEMLYQWSQEGLIMPDAASNTEGNANLIRAGKGFGYFTHLKAGSDESQSVDAGYELASWTYQEAISTTMSVALMWSISETSGDPERAMALLNLMYTDPEVSNLVINGIEGKHYQVIDEEKGIIDYPEGVDAGTTGYSRLAWGWPNQHISYIWNGASETIWEDEEAFNDNAIESPAKGFTFDNASVLNELTACTNIIDKYKKTLLAGDLDPETTIPKFLEELEAAGVDTVVAKVQAQLDDWDANR